MAGPIILANISVPLLGAVDTAVVGHLSEAYYIGAVAIGAMLFNFIYHLFNCLRMGTTGPTAQARGSGDHAGVRAMIKRALLLAGVIGSTMASDPGNVRHVVIGVGLNVNAEEDDFPADLRGSATSLRICAGRAFRRADVLARLLDAFGTRYSEFIEGGFASLRDGWDRRDFLRGRRVHLRWQGGEGWGTAAGLDAVGALRFLPDGGPAIASVHSGEILDFRR